MLRGHSFWVPCDPRAAHIHSSRLNAPQLGVPRNNVLAVLTTVPLRLRRSRRLEHLAAPHFLMFDQRARLHVDTYRLPAPSSPSTARRR